MILETSSIPSSNALLAEISQLPMKVAYLEERCRELEGMVNKNSQNSSKPPSSDGYQKANKKNGSQDDSTTSKSCDSSQESPSPKSLRQSSGKKAGGQKGHQLLAQMKPTCGSKESSGGYISCGMISGQNYSNLPLPGAE